MQPVSGKHALLFVMGTTTLPQPKLRSRPSPVLRRTLFLIPVLVLMMAVFCAVWLYRRIHSCLPQLDGIVQVAGLLAQVEVWRDARGVPHLRAHSLGDLMLAQGYVTAQDRLWQMDLDRRLAEGQLSEILGERTLRFDIDNRTLGMGLASERAVGELDPEEKNMLTAYARGVNEFISSHRNRLPIEFAVLRYEPRPWREADTFAVAMNMTKSLNTTWPDELMRERIRAKLSPELYSDLFPDHSPLDQPIAELTRDSAFGVRGSGPSQAPYPLPLLPRLTDDQGDAVSQRVGLAQPAKALNQGGIWDVSSVVSRIPNRESRAPVPDSLDLSPQLLAPSLGSNNWVLSGIHTASGKPLLANDPHLAHRIPSVWYMIHLKAAGFNVEGVSIPGVPLVIIGHNERIAWGMTNTGPDVQDLYVESFNFRDPRKYLYQGEWVDDEEREETIKVRNGRDYRFKVKITRHGPVVSHDGDRDLALQWTALAPHALRFPFLKIDWAKNWQEFTDALRDFSGPTQNFVYADVEGNIGYYAAGRIPIRAEGDGSVPSPGSTGDYEWTGAIPFENLPQAFNPSSGKIATANGRIVPHGYPYLITHKWDAPYRTARICELLRSASHLSVDDMLRIQTDVYALEDVWLKQQLLSAAAAHPTESSDGQYALDLLRHWDGQARSDSAATLVCEVARRALLERILNPKLGEDLSGYRWPMSTTFLENVLSHQWTRWLPRGDADFNDTLMKSFQEGVARIPRLVGNRRSAWKWGETIPLTFRHPLMSRFPLLGRFLNLGPYPQTGTGTTVKQTTPSLGPSMRMVVDFSDFDNSVQNITLGESGQLLSPYYHDQFDAWYSGRSFPMLFSDAAVEKGAVHKLNLIPAPPRQESLTRPPPG